jgi:thymidine phosphorylase
LPTRALITDMNQPLGSTAGNALEVQEVIDFFNGAAREQRLWQVTRALAVEMLLTSGMARKAAAAEKQIDDALASGRAAERFERMVVLAGGPKNVLKQSAKHLPRAPVVLTLQAERSACVQAMDTLAIGQAVVALGGGRIQPGAAIDARVGFSELAVVGQRVQRGDTLALVHAANHAAAEAARATLQAAIRLGAAAPQHKALIAARVL